MNVHEESTVLEAGRAIRPFISELIAGPGEAAALDRDLAAALARGDKSAAAAEVLQLLTASQPTAEWLMDFEELGLPPALKSAPQVRGVTLPGDGPILRSIRFRCPDGNDFTWYRRNAAKPIEFCPTHHVRLVPDTETVAR
jgi:hypothetical protein